MIKVGVIYGGESVEHEVSIITAVQAMSFMDTSKYDVIPIYIGKDRNWYTAECLKNMESYKNLEEIPFIAKEVTLTKKDDQFVLQKKRGLFKGVVDTIDVAFPIVHGKGVEDGSLSGYLETLGIPYVGPSMLGAAVGQDKVVQKQILQASNIPVVDYVWFYDHEYLNDEDKIVKEVKGLTKNGEEISLNKLWNRRTCTKFNGVPYITQRAAEAVYTEEGKKQVKENIKYYLENAKIIKQGLEKAGFNVYGGVNSPYIWLQIPKGMTSWEFFDKLLEEANVVGTPGSGFGPHGEGYFRLTAFNTKENTIEAIERIKKICQ